MKTKRLTALLLTALLLASCLAGCGGTASGQDAEPSAAEGSIGNVIGYPPKEISGVIQWGAGGGTDSLMRPLAVLAQDVLGANIGLTNKTGSTGAVAVEYVFHQPADGATLLMGAENPALYDTLGISTLTYDDFECVFLIGDETTGIVVPENSPYASLTELVEAAKSGTEVTLATTGTGGLPWEVAAMLKSVTGAEFTQVPYDSDASAKAAVLAGECDFTVSKVQMGYQEYKSGEYKWLCVLSKEPVELMRDVPLITAEYPEFEDLLPWGPFYGVFVKEGTDEDIVKILSDAFKKAYDDSSYQTMLGYFCINPLGYTGEDAADYIAKWRDNTVKLLNEAE